MTPSFQLWRKAERQCIATTPIPKEWKSCVSKTWNSEPKGCPNRPHAAQRTQGCHQASKKAGWSGKPPNPSQTPQIVSFLAGGLFADKLCVDVRHHDSGQLDEQNPKPQHSPQVFSETRSDQVLSPLRCTWENGSCKCVELLDETEPCGWFGVAAGNHYGSRQLTPFKDGLFLLKPDSTPARRFQIFKLAMDGKLTQFSKGLTEVV